MLCDLHIVRGGDAICIEGRRSAIVANDATQQRRMLLMLFVFTIKNFPIYPKRHLTPVVVQLTRTPSAVTRKILKRRYTVKK